jgi:hypothetical protein
MRGLIGADYGDDQVEVASHQAGHQFGTGSFDDA